ncbi:hypothetical protein [Actibacterium ureilyticum]|uniref:hypothetical protein n=1 Tax=Actibacterium ureilyticum TaxID=1590614 RepID=UPI000BAADC5D|nr:hypothetical protein [Actibacterium ureilyticum]
MITLSDTRWQAVLPLRSVDIQLPDLPKTQRIAATSDGGQMNGEFDAAFSDGSLTRAPFDPDAPTGPPPAFEANVLEARYETWARPDFDLTDHPPQDAETTAPQIDRRR